MIVAI